MELFFDELKKSLECDGAFLVAHNEGKTNIMTIGWATLGVVWYKNIITVFVRPSRYTYNFMEKIKNFSVCVPKPDVFSEALSICGSISGKEVDKIKKADLSILNGKTNGVKIIEGSSVVYECSTVHKNDINSNTLEPSVMERYYSSSDFHKVYYGEVLNAYKLLD